MRKFVTSPSRQPPPSREPTDTYIRARDPWHPQRPGETGWMMMTAQGKPVAFIPDGTEFDEDRSPYLTRWEAWSCMQEQG